MSLFADKTPALSFKGAAIGTTYTGVVTRAPELVQSRDYVSGEPDFWPANADGTRNPKMSVVLTIQLPDGAERSVWASKPSAMFGAFIDAESASGQEVRIGDTLTITFTGTEPSSDPKKEDKKLYKVVHVPGSRSAFTDTTTPAQTTPAQTPQPAAAVAPAEDFAALAAALKAAQAVTEPQPDPAAVAKARGLLAYGVTPEMVAQACGLDVGYVRGLQA